jgi:glycosyltransferase involved in cell wall biosynthesis
VISVSVVIPSYNHADKIVHAVNSVLAQTHLPDEIIVVDDGSVDDTQQILIPFKDRIRILFQENRGVAAARNVGIAASSSQWIAFLDADDIWLPNKIAAQIEQIKTLDEDIGGIYSRFQIRSDHFSLLSDLPPRAGVLSLRDVLLRNWIGLSTVVVRRDVLDQLGGFDEQLRTVEDWEMWLRILASNWRFSYLREPLMIYSLSDVALHSDAERNWKNSRRLFEKFFSAPNLGKVIGKLRPLAEANYALELARHCAANEARESAWVYFKKAAGVYPKIFLKISTYAVLLRMISGKRLYRLLRKINRLSSKKTIG